MRFKFLNLTDDDIRCSLSDSDLFTLSPGLSQLIDIPQHSPCVSLHSSAKVESTVTKHESFRIRLSLSLKSSWQTIKLPLDCRWRIYATWSSSEPYQLTILPKRNLASYLSEMPDQLPLYSLLLPGTHDTMAFYGWPISQCQSLDNPLHVQLQNGVRVIDIRLANIEGRLIAYHGRYPERTPFQSILSIIYTFLTSPLSCKETIIMSLKQEDYATTPPPVFSRLVREEFIQSPGGLDILFLENRIPKLGEVRGKVVFLSRFGGDGAGWENGLEGLGIHPTTWPDSEKNGFTWECKDVHVRTHDWYAIPSFLYIPEKVSLATNLLLPPPADDGNNRPTLSIVYTSAASFPFAAPQTIAQGFGWPRWGLGVEGVNSRLGRWVLDVFGGSVDPVMDDGIDGNMNVREKDCLGICMTRDSTRSNYARGYNTTAKTTTEPRLRGWVLVDFYDRPEQSLVDLLVECNFRGRRKGEEGW
ncbi:PLC-like phosphodiesterase [Lentinula raphanica]|nr:PLC-like phosphodiesterase [Lentinula raphanica]